MAEKCFPLENTLYTAKDAQMWFATRTSGVYAGEHLPVTASGSMGVTLGAGVAWMHYDTFAGCVYGNTENTALTVDISDAQYGRIDRVCIRLEMLNNTCHAYVKKGTAAATPVAPELQRDNVAYEISVARIYVGVGVTAINAGDITDERLDASVCGLMSDGVTGVDTSVINAQAMALINEMRDNLQAVYDGIELANVSEYTGTLAADGWSGTEPYTQTVTASGVLGSDKPFVDVDMSGVYTADNMTALLDAWSGVLKAEAVSNGVVFTMAEIPETDIPIKIKVVR